MPQTKESAKDDFQRARQRADLEKIVRSVTGKSADLLSFEDVRQKVRGVRGNRRVLKDVPLDSIVGSVGRYDDFTRDFLPRRDSDKERWAQVEFLANESAGLPPCRALSDWGCLLCKRWQSPRVGCATEWSDAH